MKRLMLNTLCVLALGTFLSAFSCYPNHIVFFDKNNNDAGSTEANPPFKTLKPHSMHLAKLPAEPTRPGYRFVGWNMKADGSGSPFHQNTPVVDDLTVYAQWEPLSPGSLYPLEVEIFSSAATLSPLDYSTSFSIALSGFANNNDANQATLQIHSELEVEVESRLEGNTKHFVVSVAYDGKTAFPEGSATLQLSLANIPEGYASMGGTQLVRLPLRDGQAKNRSIPVRQANLEAFNDYANMPNGLRQHYQLVEDVRLPQASNTECNWEPIGTGAAPFEGSFDGDNHTLSGFRSYPNCNNSDYVGLFGLLGPGATIENLGMVDVRFTTTTTTGGAGGVVGRSVGAVVQNSYALGYFEGHGAPVGGVVGINEGGVVRNCHMEGTVLKHGGTAGGVVGQNSGMVENSYAAGSVHGPLATLGGVVGTNAAGGVVQSSYATAELSTAGTEPIGGVVGQNSGTLRNCYSTGSLSGNLYIAGGVVGQNSGTVQNCYAAGGVDHAWGTVGGIVANDGGTVQNCVALHSILRATSLPGMLWRIGGHATSMNYAREDMEAYAQGALFQPSDSELGLSTAHGQNLALSSIQSRSWWATSSNWLTTGGASAWDFESVWAWGPGRLPILQNAGGMQNPSLQ